MRRIHQPFCDFLNSVSKQEFAVFSIEDLLTLSRTQDITCSGMTLFNSVLAKSRCSFTRCLLSFAIIFALKDCKNHPVLSKIYLEIESMGNFIGTVFKEKQ